MKELDCVGGRMSVYLDHSGSIDKIKILFPKAVVVNTFNQLSNVSDKGVYLLNDDGRLVVRIYGGCPNFLQGKCSLGEKCISNLSV